MLVAIVILLLMLAFLAMAETALNRISKVKAQAIADSMGTRSARQLARLAHHPERFINALLVTITICQTAQAFLTSILADRLFGTVGLIVAFVLNVVVFFVLAEAVPKTYAVLHPERAALFSTGPTAALVGFPPLQFISRALIGLTNVLLPGKGLKQGPFVSEQELLGIVEAAAEDEVIEHEERELIESIIEFGDTVAREVMVPRPDMVTIPHDADGQRRARHRHRARLQPAARHGRGRGRRRGPRLRQGPHAGRAGGPRRRACGRRRPQGPLHPREQAAQPAHAGDAGREVPPRDRRRRVRRHRRDGHAGGLPGGAGRRDRRRVRPGGHGGRAPARRRPTSSTEAMGISDLNDLLEIALPDEDWDTVAGFVFSTLGHVPERGEAVSANGWRFAAEQVDGRRIRRVRVSVEPRGMTQEGDGDHDDHAATG